MFRNFNLVEKGGVALFVPDGVQEPFKVVFSTRKGGFSRGPFSGLNLGWHTGDDPETLDRNFQAFLDALGIERSNVVWPRQVHGSRAVEVRATACCGPLEVEADALVTCEKGLFLMMFYADCVPIVMIDRHAPRVGIAHVGWRGLLAGVIENFISLFDIKSGPSAAEEHFSQECLIGPSIGPCCFEIGEDVLKRLRERYGRLIDQNLFMGKGRPRVDLAGVCESVLARCGVKKRAISRLRVCTSCSVDLFYSHRRDKPVTGRQCALVGMMP